MPRTTMDVVLGTVKGTVNPKMESQSQVGLSFVVYKIFLDKKIEKMQRKKHRNA